MWDYFSSFCHPSLGNFPSCDRRFFFYFGSSEIPHMVFFQLNFSVQRLCTSPSTVTFLKISCEGFHWTCCCFPLLRLPCLLFILLRNFHCMSWCFLIRWCAPCNNQWYLCFNWVCHVYISQVFLLITSKRAHHLVQGSCNSRFSKLECFKVLIDLHNELSCHFWSVSTHFQWD